MIGRMRRHKGDDGTIGILTLGFTVLAAMVILVIASITSVHLTRLRLTHLADELAIDASDALDKADYYSATQADPNPQLAQRLMERAVLADMPHRAVGHLEGATVTRVSSADGSTALVTVQVTVYPLFGVEALLPFADGITLTATGQARNF